MDAERWRRIEELYHATLKRRPSERGFLINSVTPELNSPPATVLLNWEAELKK
jgi:hypothetical protein